MLLIGFVDQSLIAKAKEYSPTPILVTEENWQKFVKDTNAVGYTRLEEFDNKDYLIQLLNSVDEIEYVPYKNQDVNSRDYLEQILLFRDQKLFLYKKHTIKNFIENLRDYDSIKKTLDCYLNLVDNRKTYDPQLWIAGCSTTYGIGVRKDQRYGNLLAKKLKKRASFLAYPGSSISWAADQILRSDIRKNDIVIWGLTLNNRFAYYVDNEIHHVNLVAIDNNIKLSKHLHGKLLVDSDNLMYKNIISIYQVINFCYRINAKLLLVGVAGDDLQKWLHHTPNFFQVPLEFIDIGNDNRHPGPKCHKLYSDLIYEQMDQRDWIK